MARVSIHLSNRLVTAAISLALLPTLLKVAAIVVAVYPAVHVVILTAELRVGVRPRKNGMIEPGAHPRDVDLLLRPLLAVVERVGADGVITGTAAGSDDDHSFEVATERHDCLIADPRTVLLHHLQFLSDVPHAVQHTTAGVGRHELAEVFQVARDVFRRLTTELVRILA